MEIPSSEQQPPHQSDPRRMSGKLNANGTAGQKALLPVASVMDTAKVRGTRSSRLREEAAQAAANAKMSRTAPISKPHSSAASSASSNHSTPHATSTAVTQAAAPPPPLSLSSTQPKGKLTAALQAATKSIHPSAAAVSQPARAKSAGTSSRPMEIIFHDADPSPSSVPSRTAAQSAHASAAPSIASSTSNSNASSTASISLFSMPPTISSASPRLVAKSMSILNLRTPSPSVSSTSSGKFTGRLSQRTSVRPPPQAASLSTAQRAVLEDIHIIADWLSTVQHSEPQHLLQFRSVIQRMKKVIFTPAQVRRSRAQQKERIAAAPVVVPARRPVVATGANVTPLQRRIAALSTTSLLTMLDMTGHHPPAASLGASDSPRTDDDAVPPDYLADDSDYDELDGGGLDHEFESKLSSFIRKTTKKDEEVLKSGGTGSYPHAAGVAFENGRWVQKHDSHHSDSSHGGASGSHIHSAGSKTQSRFGSARSYSSEGGVSATSECSDYEEGALDDIPDFSQTRQSVGYDHDPSSSSPSSSQKTPGGGSVSSMSLASGAIGRARASSNSQSQSYNFSGKRSGSGGGRAGGASSVSAGAGQVSPGFDDSEEVSTSMRSDSPSHAVSVSQSQSVFSLRSEDREMLLMFGDHSQQHRGHDGDGDHMYAEHDRRELMGDEGEEEDDGTQTLLPLGTKRSAGTGGNIPPSPVVKKLRDTPADEMDALDSIPDFDDAPANPSATVATVASVRPQPMTAAAALAPFPFATPANAAAQPSASSATASSTSTPTSSGPTLITLKGWQALGRPSSIDASTVAASGGLSAVALAVLTPSSTGTRAGLSLPSAPSDPSTESLFVKSTKPDEFPEELDFEDEEEEQEQQQQDQEEEEEEQLKPLNQPAKTVVKPVAMGTTGGGGRAGSKMQTFTSMPANLKPTAPANQPLRLPLNGASGSDQDDANMDDFELIMSPASSASATSTVSSNPDAASAGASKFDRINAARAAKSFNQRTLAKKKSTVDAEEFPSDLDDLSDADWSDEDRSTSTKDEKETKIDPALLGPAARMLNEFDLTKPGLKATFEASQRAWDTAFDGCLLMNAGGEARRRELLQSDGMTSDLRAEYLARDPASFFPSVAAKATAAAAAPVPAAATRQSSGGAAGSGSLPPRSSVTSQAPVRRPSPTTTQQRSSALRK